MDAITKSFLCGKMYSDVGQIRSLLKSVRRQPNSEELKALMHDAHNDLEEVEYKLLKVHEQARAEMETSV